MVEYRIRKSQLKGAIVVPSSKSQTLRAILFASMAKGKSSIHKYLHSPDTDAMIEACRLLGAKIEVYPSSLNIEGLDGQISHAEDVINAGNSGIVLRFCTALGALASRPVVITGDYSIRHQRPMKELLSGLNQLGVSATSMRGDGYAPVIIQGPLKQGHALIQGSDSQPVSALLIAAAFAKGPTQLTIENLGEKPWVLLTLDWFNRLGIAYEGTYLLPGLASYSGFEYTVPGDLSSAAFPIAAALVTGSELTVHNVNIDDIQGDKELIFILQEMGAKIESEGSTLYVKKSVMNGLKIDINNFVDSLPILSVVACFAKGETHIHNAAICRDKECDRIHAITAELSKMGADIQELSDGLIIRNSILKGSNLHSYHDHRMAMALTVAALGSHGETFISPVECIAKTFPNFKEEFNRLGANIR